MGKKKHPRKIGSIVNQLMARRGYAQVQVAGEMDRVLASVTSPEIANQCMIGKINRGVLEIGVSDSVIVQELSFQKRQIIAALQKEFPQSGISDIRFRIAAK